VFLHEEFRFEVWLSDKNKRILTKYWKLLIDSGWEKYKIVEPTKGIDSIIEHILVDKPDFGDLDAMTHQIDFGTVKLIQEVENFLSLHHP
jgi:hypothetical protein